MPAWDHGWSVQMLHAGGGPKDRAMRENWSSPGMPAIRLVAPATRRMLVTIQGV